jgi:Flp pilus assembly protein TadD
VSILAAKFFFAAGMSDRAETVLAEHLRGEPNSIEAYRLLGAVLLRAGKFDACIELYRRATDVFEEKWARDDFGDRLERVYREASREAAAAAAAEAARAEADREWSKLSLELARRLEEKGLGAEAVQVYRKLATLARDATIREDAAGRLKALDAADEGKTPLGGVP